MAGGASLAFARFPPDRASCDTGRMAIPELFRDARFVVLDKPAGLKVHAGPGGGPSVEDGFAALSRRRDGPWLVHRLDADTAGCLVVALRKAALVAAQAEFAGGRAVKTYWAVVVGGPAGEILAIDKHGMVVGCGTDALRLLLVQREGGRRMAVREFLAGHQLQPGDRFV